MPLASELFTLTLARQHHQQGNLVAAKLLYEQVLAQCPDRDDALFCLGLLAYQAGDRQAAKHYWERTLAVNPHQSQALNNLGLLYKELGKFTEAIALLERALALNSTSTEIATNLGNIHNNLGIALTERGDAATAIPYLQRALDLLPRSPDVRLNLAHALKEKGVLGEESLLQAAIAQYEQALALRPDWHLAHCGLGNALRFRGELTRAIAHYRQAIALAPDDGEAHFGLALSLLTAGHLPAGWQEYEWRWHTRKAESKPFAFPMWDGRSLAGKTLLLYAEQGFGDTMQFARYVPLVAARGGRVWLHCQKSLERLLANLPGVERIFTEVEAVPEVDLCAPLMSLPWIFGTTLESIPGDVPYLFALDRGNPTWNIATNGLRVGLVWGGNPENPYDRRRAVPFSQFQILWQLPGVTFYSLQKGDRAAEVAGAPLRDLVGDCEDFADTARAIAALDLVISIDTAVAHLAGALGKPVWLLLPYAADWRWLLHREDSPWYPTMRLFRQPRTGDWTSVLQRVAIALSEEVRRRAIAPTGMALEGIVEF